MQKESLAASKCLKALCGNIKNAIYLIELDIITTVFNMNTQGGCISHIVNYITGHFSLG